jgi:hypothetical protein
MKPNAKQALEIWKDISHLVTYQALQDYDRHEVVHELSRIIKQGLVDGEITMSQL